MDQLLDVCLRPATHHQLFLNEIYASGFQVCFIITASATFMLQVLNEPIKPILQEQLFMFVERKSKIRAYKIADDRNFFFFFCAKRGI